MANAEDTEDLGPWSNANLRMTARLDAGIGANSGIPAEIRFRSSVAKLVRRRNSMPTASSDPLALAIFVMSPTAPPSLDAKRVPMLDNGLTQLAGRVWFVGAGSGSGHFIPLAAEDDDDAFVFITDDLLLGDAPTIVYDPRLMSAQLRSYPNGLSNLDVYDEFPLSGTPVTIQTVAEAVDVTHAEKMITYTAQPKAGKLWKNHNKWWPAVDAEDRVQMYLEIGLNTAFPTCTVRREQDVPEGRLDLEIIESDPVDRSKITQHAILELKVLRSFSETGKSIAKSFTRNWIRSGVEQAAAYRDSKSAIWGALFCFDMRVDDCGDSESFSGVKKLAHGLNVHLRRWFIYGTAKQLQGALAKAKLG